MTHDPLCPSYGLCDCGCEYDAHCMCGFITKVRADTLDKAVQRVEQNILVGTTLTPKEVRAVIAAVRGQS